jgi:hypothetical protein
MNTCGAPGHGDPAPAPHPARELVACLDGLLAALLLCTDRLGILGPLLARQVEAFAELLRALSALFTRLAEGGFPAVAPRTTAPRPPATPAPSRLDATRLIPIRHAPSRRAPSRHAPSQHAPSQHAQALHAPIPSLSTARDQIAPRACRAALPRPAAPMWHHRAADPCRFRPTMPASRMPAGRSTLPLARHSHQNFSPLRPSRFRTCISFRFRN